MEGISIGNEKNQRSYHPSVQEGRQTRPNGNYRAITLLSIPGKVICRMILNRIQVTIWTTI